MEEEYDLTNMDYVDFDIPKPTEEEIQADIERVQREEAKKEIERQLANLKVEQHGIPYDANAKAQVNMTSVVALLNWNFNKAIGNTLEAMSTNPELDETSKVMLHSLGQVFNGIYNEVYHNVKVPWKGADNNIHLIQGESLAEALEKTMKTLASTIGVVK